MAQNNNLILQLLITAQNQASQELENLRERLDGVGDGADSAGQRARILQDALGELVTKVGAAVAFGTLATQFIEANREADKLAKQFRAMTGDTQAAAQEIEFLRTVADRWGTSVTALSPAYLRLAAAVKGTTAEGEPARKMIDDLSASYINAGQSIEDMEEVMEIVGEAFADGRVSIDDLREGMQEDMPPAIQAATTAVLENNAALQKMLETGDAATEDFMPAFAAALREHIGGSQDQVNTTAAAFARLTAQLNDLYIKIDDNIPLVAVYDEALQGLIKIAETGVAALSALTDGAVFVGKAVGAAAGAIASGGDVIEAVSEQADTAGASLEKTALHLVGLKTATEEATERQAQMQKELQALQDEAEPYAAALRDVTNSLEDAQEEFTQTGDAAALTTAALEELLKVPELRLNTEGIYDLAAALKVVGQQASDSGQQISDTLGQELAKLTDDQLTRLETQARAALKAASDGSAEGRQAFAELGQIVEGVVLARLERLGVDGPEALRGISVAAEDAIADFTALAEHGELSADTIEAAFEGALAQLDNPQELERFRERILALGRDGALSSDQVTDALAKIEAAAAKTAGPDGLGMLTNAQQRAIEAARSYTDQQSALATAQARALQASYDLAIAQGREADARQLLLNLARNEANQATINATKKNIEAEAAYKVLATLEREAGAILAAGQAIDDTTQKRLDSARIAAETAAIEAQAAGQVAEAERQKAASVALGNVQTEQQTEKQTENTQATEQHTQATEKNSDAQAENIKHTNDATAAAKGLSAYLALARQEVDELSEATRSLFEAELSAALYNAGILNSYNSKRDAIIAYKDGVGAGKKALSELQTELNNANLLIDQSQERMLGATSAWGKWQAAIELATGKAKAAFYEQAIAAEEAAQRIERGIDTNLQQLQQMVEGVENAKRGFNLLDEQDLSRLESAIDAANNKLREMQEETQDARARLAELNAELLEEQGADDKAALLRQQLDYQQQLAEIEAQRQEAELTGNRELLTILAQQEALLTKINQTRVNNIQAEAEANRAERTTTTRTTSSAAPASASAAPAKRIQVDLSFGRQTLSTYTDQDPSAFLDALEAAQRRSL